MMEGVYTICYVGLIIAVAFSLIRLIKGPTIPDRVLAFDSIALCAAGIAVLFSIQTSTVYYIEVLLIFSLLGFTTVMGYMDYLSEDS